MKGVIYSDICVSCSKVSVLALLLFSLCTSKVQSQTTYLSTFEDPTGKYAVNRPSCTLNALPPSINNSENVSSATLTDYATLNTTVANATLVCNGVYLINADLNLGGLNTIPASSSNPYYAGFKVTISSALLANLIGGGSDAIVIRTYQDGVPVQSAGGSAIGLSLLQGGVPGNINFSTTQPFNQVAVEISSGILSLGLASSINFFYAFASTAPVPIILPVKLSSFLAVVDNKKVTVNWTTTSEINVVKYELQRSSDGGNIFNSLTTIAAKGNTSSETNYSYADGTALSGSYTYRLKMVDKDGKAEYSKLATVKLTTNAHWKVYPTLLSSGTDVTISFTTADNGKTQVQLTNLQGQVLRSGNPITDGRLTIATSGLAAGMYILKLYKDGQLQTSEKVVIQ